MPGRSDVRSEAAQAASRTNGAKSRGPKTKQGKAISAKNAVRHGLRARAAMKPGDLPSWLVAFETNVLANRVDDSQSRREQLDLLLSVMLRIDATDRAIAAEFAYPRVTQR